MRLELEGKRNKSNGTPRRVVCDRIQGHIHPALLDWLKHEADLRDITVNCIAYQCLLIYMPLYNWTINHSDNGRAWCNDYELLSSPSDWIEFKCAIGGKRDPRYDRERNKGKLDVWIRRDYIAWLDGIPNRVTDYLSRGDPYYLAELRDLGYPLTRVGRGKTVDASKCRFMHLKRAIIIAWKIQQICPRLFDTAFDRLTVWDKPPNFRNKKYIQLFGGKISATLKELGVDLSTPPNIEIVKKNKDNGSNRRVV